MASGQNNVGDFVLDTAEVCQRLLELEKKWGKQNLLVLLSHRCTFGGRVRSMPERMKLVEEVFVSLRALQKELPKCP